MKCKISGENKKFGYIDAKHDYGIDIGYFYDSFGLDLELRFFKRRPFNYFHESVLMQIIN
jgi:hypothetical protein